MTMTGTRVVTAVSIIRWALVAIAHFTVTGGSTTATTPLRGDGVVEPIASTLDHTLVRISTVVARHPDQFVTFVTVGVVLAGVLLYYVLALARPTLTRIVRSDQVDPDELQIDDRTRVLQLLARNKGHMRQTAIVESVEWSKAKVSRLLSDLEGDDEIRRVRLGRENVVYLRGYEPATLGSPFDTGDRSQSRPQGRSDDGPTDNPTETRR